MVAGKAGIARNEAVPPRVPFAEAFRFWVKLGFISFGGPAGQIAIMHRELVDRRRWISEERFLHALNYCMLLPGPEAQQLAIYIGWLMHRTAGGIVAGAFFVIPSIFILLALSYMYAAYGEVAAVAGVLDGFKPVVVAIVVEAVMKIGGRALKRRSTYAIAAAAFLAIYRFARAVSAHRIAGGIDRADRRAACAAALRRCGCRCAADDDAAGRAADRHRRSRAAAGAHLALDAARFARTLALGVVLWLLPYLLLLAWRGCASLHAQSIASSPSPPS